MLQRQILKLRIIDNGCVIEIVLLFDSIFAIFLHEN